MRAIASATLVMSLASWASAQTPSPQTTKDADNLQHFYCPNAHQLEVAPSQKFFLDGTIGKRHVRMYLDRGGSGVVGLFFDIDGNWDTTLLGGTWNNGEIDASDAAENHPTGHLKASLADNHLNGTWTAEGSDQAEPVELAAIPEPACDGKEEWKRFDDPAWPFSFSYPASWHLERSDKTITLACPNPKEIAYDGTVTIYAGSGSFKGPTKLLQCGNSWIYGSECDCSHEDGNTCDEAKVSRLRSATALDVGEHEWRVYCSNGGYVGQGYGEDRVVLLPHAWAEVIAELKSSEIIERLIATISAHPASQSSPHPASQSK